MKTIQINAANRGDFGKKATKAVRREGFIPCVLYGGGAQDVPQLHAPHP